MTKVTNKMALEYVIAMVKGETPNAEVEQTEIIAKLEKMLEQNVARSSRERKPSAKEIAEKQKKVALADKIVCEMEIGRLYTSAEIMEIWGIDSVSAVTNLLKSAVENNTIVKQVIKRKVHYSLA